jgi:nitrate reductase gamma subunit
MAFQWFSIGFAWTSIVLFIAAAAYKFFRIASMPLNLRWEVYPVPHETGERHKYGGSYMEEVDWAKKTKTTSRISELKEMGAEIFFLKRIRRHNPYGIWPYSMAMHWGLYLLVGWIVLLAIADWIPVSAVLAILIGIASFILGIIGATGLILKRANNQDLNLYTSPVDYFNLGFLIAIFGTGFVSWVIDPGFLGHQAYIQSLITFNPSPVSPLPVICMFFLLQGFIIYMPFSKLIHYIMKHFTLTEILWDDMFNVKGSGKDHQIERQLSYKKNWAAPHFSSDKTWKEDVHSALMEERQRE